MHSAQRGANYRAIPKSVKPRIAQQRRERNTVALLPYSLPRRQPLMVDLSKIPDPPENQSDTILYWDDETRQWVTFEQRRRLLWKRIGADTPRRPQYKRRYDT